MQTKHNWKYTIPITRAEETDDGFFLEGEASGPERDTHGTRMSPEAIQDFARQIADRVEMGNPLPYIDQHLKRGVTRQLGDVLFGVVNPENSHLRVRVQLDEDNPNAMMIHKKIALRGKQYGMSIAGSNADFDWEYDEQGNKTPLFTKVELSEISHTPAPSWVPSLGTVLARSIEEDDGQEIEMSDELDTTAADEQTPVTEAEQETPVASDENVELSEQPEAEAEVTAEEATEETEVENTDSEDEQEVERARIAQADRAAVLEAFGNLATQLRNLGMDPVEAVQPAADTTPDATEPQNVENSENGETDEVTRETVAEMVTEALKPLSETIDRQTAYINELENLPAGKKPAPLVREKFESDEPRLEDMSSEERMRYALNAIYNAN